MGQERDTPEPHTLENLVERSLLGIDSQRVFSLLIEPVIPILISPPEIGVPPLQNPFLSGKKSFR